MTPRIEAHKYPERLHSLDSLRASMMLLGIVFHIVLLYTDFPQNRVPDSQTGAAFDFIYFLLHSFRMPVFFIVSGFFTTLLYQRRGTKALIANRAGRILVPLLIGWLPLFILTVISFAYAIHRSGAKLLGLQKHITGWAFVRDNSLGHLWFLYYLVMYYLLALVAFTVWRALPAAVRKSARSAFVWVVASPFGVLFLAAITFPALLPSPFGVLDSPISLIPSLSMLFVYGLFFGFGMALYGQRDLLYGFQKGAWIRLAAGLALFPWNYAALQRQGSPVSNDVASRALAAATESVIVWLLALALLGLFFKYGSEHNRYVRYMTDSSYWLYLIHLPLVTFVCGWLAPFALPLWMKPVLILIISTPLLLLSYHYCVRSTFIGKTLNGRKYPRVLPEIEMRPAPATV